MRLFEPITIQGMELKNRVVMAAMGFCTFSLTDKDRKGKVLDFYGERAKGGVGSIILGAVPPSYFLPQKDVRQPDDVPRFIEAIGEFVARMHRDGAKVGIQLFVACEWPSGSPVAMGPEWVAPSPKVENVMVYVPPGQARREMTTSEIDSFVEQFALAAPRVKKTGVDFIELHLAHGHLPDEFFSPIDNRRRDKYGGDLHGRMTFGLSCLKGMRAAVGPEYPIFCRVGAHDDRPGGATLDDVIAFAVELEKAGGDCLDVSVGATDGTYRHHLSPQKRRKMGTFAPQAAAIRKKVKVPVIAVGRINTPEVAENILVEGQADLVAIGRQLITDPHWVKKVAEGRADAIIPCDSCNANCWGNIAGKQADGTVYICHKIQRPGEERSSLVAWA